jgi:hypothetical protein
VCIVGLAFHGGNAELDKAKHQDRLAQHCSMSSTVPAWRCN